MKVFIQIHLSGEIISSDLIASRIEALDLTGHPQTFRLGAESVTRIYELLMRGPDMM